MYLNEYIGKYYLLKKDEGSDRLSARFEPQNNNQDSNFNTFSYQSAVYFSGNKVVQISFIIIIQIKHK